MDEKKLPPEEVQQFTDAKRKEWQSMMEEGAIKVLNACQSSKVRQMLGDRIMQGRFVLTKKALEEVPPGAQSWKARARYVICGFTDPDLLSLPRAAPVANTEAVHLVCLLCVQLGLRMSIGDISTAYLNSPAEERESGKVFVSLRNVPDVPNNHVGEILKLVYGTIHGGHAWFTISE